MLNYLFVALGGSSYAAARIGSTQIADNTANEMIWSSVLPVGNRIFVGIATFILRDTEHLAAVEVIGDAMVLTTLRFSDELADITAFSWPSSRDVRKPELEMAKSLVNSLAAEWEPSK